MTSSLILVSALALVSGLASIAVVSAGSCASCPITHPQQKFCHAAFVLKVRTVSWQYVDGNNRPVLYSSTAYDVQYKVKVENVFRGKKSGLKEGKMIFIYSPKNVCSIDTLDMGIRYLISGRMRGDKMEVTTCGIVEKWSDLSPSQRRGVRGAYDSQCRSCMVYGSTIMRFFGGKEMTDSTSSGLWTKENCFFNPLASFTYGSEDCETKFGFCMRQENGGCAWEGTKAYDQCFRQREYNWQLMQFSEMGLAAWTCPEQCKDLTPKKLKYKCKKATRKMPPCNSPDTVREFGPSGARDNTRTVNPSSVVETRTEVPNFIAMVLATEESAVKTVAPNAIVEG